MIWIATLCLLAVIAWLFFNALNERRWVEAHSHDESVAADPGFLPDLSRFTSKLLPAADGERSAGAGDSPLRRAVETVREKSVQAGESIQHRVAEARAGDAGNSALGRTVGKLTGKARELDARLDERSREHAAAGHGAGGSGASLIERATARVTQTGQDLGARVRERVASTKRVDGGTPGRIVDADGRPVTDADQPPPGGAREGVVDADGRPVTDADQPPPTGAREGVVDADGRPVTDADRPPPAGGREGGA